MTAQTVTLNLSVDETNVILNALGQQPYVQVAQVITNIHNQYAAQVVPQAPAAPQKHAVTEAANG